MFLSQKIWDHELWTLICWLFKNICIRKLELVLCCTLIDAEWMQICIPNQMHSLHCFSCSNLNNALIRDLSCDLSLNTNAGVTLLHPLSSLCFSLPSCSFKDCLLIHVISVCIDSSLEALLKLISYFDTFRM